MAKAIASLNPGNAAAEAKPSSNLWGPCIDSIRVMHFVSGLSVQNHSGVDSLPIARGTRLLRMLEP